MITYYTILAVKESSSIEEIKTAYRRLVLIYHPDRSSGSSEMFIKIQQAYEVLSDPIKRSEYDVRLKAYRERIKERIKAGINNDQPNTQARNSSQREKEKNRSTLIKMFAGFIFFIAIMFWTDITKVWNNLNQSTASENTITPTRWEEENRRKEEKEVSPYKDYQLKNGDAPYSYYFGANRYDYDLNNYIDVDNGTNADVIVILYDVSKQKYVRNSYIRAGVKFRIKNIPEGVYNVRCLYGNSWNPTLEVGGIIGNFEENVTYSETSKKDYFDMRVERTYEGDFVPSYSLTLQKVVNGNLSMPSVNRRDFFSLQ